MSEFTWHLIIAASYYLPDHKSVPLREFSLNRPKRYEPGIEKLLIRFRLHEVREIWKLNALALSDASSSGQLSHARLSGATKAEIDKAVLSTRVRSRHST